MLQIQHTDGNELLTRLNEALKFQHFGDFAPMAARFAVINSAKWADETPPWT